MRCRHHHERFKCSLDHPRFGLLSDSDEYEPMLIGGSLTVEELSKMDAERVQTEEKELRDLVEQGAAMNTIEDKLATAQQLIPVGNEVLKLAERVREVRKRDYSAVQGIQQIESALMELKESYATSDEMKELQHVLSSAKASIAAMEKASAENNIPGMEKSIVEMRSSRVGDQVVDQVKQRKQQLLDDLAEKERQAAEAAEAAAAEAAAAEAKKKAEEKKKIPPILKLDGVGDGWQ
eukprot:gnl/MRDRNA2_/MRDRNA2_83840_c0_seq1.p1 gnl/MRDRNA2_/MRDRNA2_83840_c0~~gnl/MRDRNA2_/MRDRNA2_83840_c0_seq1.p1  ORF type:complete len:236 (-),score=83.25 gnl/MRDRNA2_/MRDRNA2_83840_c0_seq1:666-1373(-)